MKNNLSKDRFLCKCFLEFKFVASKKFFAYFLACLTLNSMCVCVCEVNVRVCVCILILARFQEILTKEYYAILKY